MRRKRRGSASGRGRSWGTRSCASRIPISSRGPRGSWTTSLPKEGSTPSRPILRRARAPPRHRDRGGARDAGRRLCAYKGDDLGLPPMHEVEDVPEAFARPILCDGTIRFVGEPVAVVVADSRAHAVDAAESVLVEYDALPAVVDPVRALEPDAPVLFPEHGSNAAVEYTVATDLGALEDTEVVIRARFVNQRLAPTPIERTARSPSPTLTRAGSRCGCPCRRRSPRGRTCASPGNPEPRGVQRPRHRAEGRRRVRREDPDLRGAGGGLCARAAARATRPVRVETRTESMTS